MSREFKLRLLALLLCLLVLFLLFRPNFLEVREGERIFVFQLPGEARPGGSVGADLKEQLLPRHGAAVYSFHYLGRSLQGRQYILCLADDTRYIAVNELGNEVRAYVLWDTMYEGY